MQSTRSASMSALRISPSPDWLEDMLPLARTKPAMSSLATLATCKKASLAVGAQARGAVSGARWWMKCCTQANVRVALGRDAILPADVVVLAVIVLRFAHDLQFGCA